jgi:hypothetical protein
MKRKLQIASFLMFTGFVGVYLLPRLFVANANSGASLDSQSSTNSEAVINQLPEIQELRHTKIGF